MFDKILIANRGEIALRIHRACKEMGISTVAVHSEADSGAMWVRLADESVCIGPPAAAKSYLNIPAIIAAAEITGAQAIHPGYGFLSENARFAEIVGAHGFTFIGPKPEHIKMMGDKITAKQVVKDAGIPVVPGSDGAVTTEEEAFEAAKQIGFPVLIKAAAGGGGRGMKVAQTQDDLYEAVSTARGEAKAAFGDDAVYMERYLQTPRHIELQVIADSFGNVCHLGERDCSLQRRHQKVIEEAPAPGMTDEARAAVTAAAVKAAQAVGYQGAGTVEFIADASAGLRGDRIWFMEMNTRLQVEHPVTEMVTGLDLVEWQFRVAAGEPLPLTQDQIALSGHAVEARLYAENPATGFLPSIGRLESFSLPQGVRIDAGVEEGDEISPHYDPMIAKLIAHAPTREAAIAELAEACAEVEIYPVRSNAGFLVRCLESPDFIAGAVDTGLIGRELEVLTTPAEPSPEALATAGWAFREQVEREAETVGPSPWVSLSGFRLNAPAATTTRLFLNGQAVEVELGAGPSRTVHVLGEEAAVVFEAGEAFVFRDHPPAADATGSASDGQIRAPMPGKVTVVGVAAGDKVTKGQPLVTLEAMKMEHALTAPFDGIVDEVAATLGAQVSEGTVLVRMTAE